MSETAAAAAPETSKITRPQRNIFADRMIRDVIVQTSLVVGLALLIWFFSRNYIANGFSVNWAFLTNPASVDPGEPAVLPVTASSSVLSLFGFGILNTAIVAVTGIALATVLGFAMGVMRLSSNFLLSRMAQVYIEVLRNIPLTVIFLFLAAALRLLPEIGSAFQVGEVLLHNSTIDMPALKFGQGNGTGTWLGIAPFSWYIFPTTLVEGYNWHLALYHLAYIGLVAFIFVRFTLPRILSLLGWVFRFKPESRTYTNLLNVGLVLVGLAVLVSILGIERDGGPFARLDQMTFGFLDWSFFPTFFSLTEAENQGTLWLVVVFYVWAFLGLIAVTFFYLIPALNTWAAANTVGGRKVNRNRETISSLVVTTVLTLLVLLYFSVETTFPPLMGWSMFAVFIIALLWASFVRTALNNWADDKLDATGKRPNVGLLGWGLFIGTLLAIFVAIGGPIGTESYVFNDKGRAVFGFKVPVTFIALILALAIYTSAFIAEIVRSGIQSVAKGQTEAAASLGLKPGRIMSLITIPQALKVIVPPLNSQFMNLAKNSSLALLLQIPDVIGALRNPLNNTGRELEIVFMILLTYLFISLTISVAMNYMNARVQVVER